MHLQNNWVGGDSSETRLRLDLLELENRVQDKNLQIKSILC